MTVYGLDKDNDGKPDGVWILQNSWNADQYEEYYITYSSKIFELFGVRKIIDKNWDNCYNISNYGDVKINGTVIKQESTLATIIGDKQYDGNYEAVAGTVKVTYNKPNFKAEKLKMINFVSASQNSKYKIYISADGTDKNYKFIKEVDTDLPGLYSVEMDDILLNKEKFSVKIESDNGAMYTTINAFSCNDENIILSDEITSYVDNGFYNENGNYEYHVISNSPNINDGQLFKYVLKDDTGNILLSTVRKYAVARNGQAIGKIEFPSNFEIGKKFYVNIWKDDTLIDTLEINYNPKSSDYESNEQDTDNGTYQIHTYDCKEDKKIIDNILPTTIEHYKENIAIENPYTAKVFKIKKEDGNEVEEEVTEGNIATGMITKIYLEDKFVEKYTNIVPGDLDGDGIIRSRDCSMLKQYLIGMRDNMYETPAYYAADFTRDGKVKLNDAERIQQYAVKMFELNEEDYYGKND